MFGSYRRDDVTLLLKDITGQIEPLGTQARERKIQSGTPYYEMLPIEYEPTPAYLHAYQDALARYAGITAEAVGCVARQIWEQKGDRAALVSLARAGTPVGILIKRYLKTYYHADVTHASVSIIRGRGIDAYYAIRMADTWTPVFDLSTPEKTARFTGGTEAAIGRVIRDVRERRVNRHMSPRVPAILVRLTAQPLYDREMRRTAHLRVEESCVGCGLCVRKCPVQAMALRDGRPVWVKEKCVMCLGCLHRCPKFAIQYGKRTKGHGQYTNPHVTV